MKLVILVAGVGSRLRPLTDTCPKCLVEVGGRSILGRFLELSEAVDEISEVVLVTGYLREQISDFVKKWSINHRLPVHLVHNPRYDETNNGYTLSCAKDQLRDGFILTDGDLLLDQEILARVAHESQSHLAVDRLSKLDAEAMKFKLDEDGNVTELSKEISVEEGLGESIGLCKINAADAPLVIEQLADVMKNGGENEYYERAFQELIVKNWHLKVQEVGDLNWVEVDDHNDLERAERIFG